VQNSRVVRILFRGAGLYGFELGCEVLSPSVSSHSIAREDTHPSKTNYRHYDRLSYHHKTVWQTFHHPPKPMELVCQVSSFAGRHERLMESVLEVRRLEMVVRLTEDVGSDDISRKGCQRAIDLEAPSALDIFVDLGAKDV